MISKYGNFSSYNHYSTSRFLLGHILFQLDDPNPVERERYPTQIQKIQLSGRIGLQNTDPVHHWWAEGEPPSSKLNTKTGPPLAHIHIFRILLVFCGLLFFGVFQGVFVFLASIDIHNMRIHYPFLTFFWVLASGPPTVGPFQLSFAPPGTNL